MGDRDSRVEKIVERFDRVSPDHLPFGLTPSQTGEWIIRWAESAGLLVLLPGEELVERIAREIAGQAARYWADMPTDYYVNRYWHQFKPRAEQMLAALASLRSTSDGAAGDPS